MKKTIMMLLLAILPYSISQATMVVEKLELPREINSDLSIELQLFNTFLENDIDTVMAKILVAQASHESGRFKNPLTKKHHNVFSIMHTSKRQTLSLGGFGYAEGRGGYCSYSSTDSSAIDMLMYMKFRKIPNNFSSVTEFSRELKKKKYFEADEKLYAKAVYAHYRAIWLVEKRLKISCKC